jgi:hypothetical protein
MDTSVLVYRAQCFRCIAQQFQIAALLSSEIFSSVRGPLLPVCGYSKGAELNFVVFAFVKMEEGNFFYPYLKKARAFLQDTRI